jgi:ATP-dependent helicase HrpB
LRDEPLPIDAVIPDIVGALQESAAVVIRAPAGAGKTTRVPPAVLDAGLAGNRAVVVLEPRRMAARAAARRVARERGGAVGDEIGYHVRFDRRSRSDTRVLFVTEGVFLRRIQDDPFLDGVGAVVFDEFHERSLDSDLALALAREVGSDARPDLKLIVMSATLEPAPIAAYLGGCPVVESAGRLHPVCIDYDPAPVTVGLDVRVERAVERMLEQSPGDVLVFLPGVGEIERASETLAGLARRRDLEVMPLYGDLSAEAQDRVLAATPRRKIVLSTNVAETSITIEGITAVVDTGLVRKLRFNPGVGLNRLELMRVSRAAADQRAGRAGRTAPGTCLRLWSPAEHRTLAASDTPEIHRLDLAGPVLELFCWGRPDVRAFDWFEPPAPAQVDHALSLLERLGAIDRHGITAPGRTMARLPVQPRLARLLVDGHRLGHPAPTALAAALLSERSPFRIDRGPDPRHRRTDSDVVDRLQALEAFQRSGTLRADVGEIRPGAARFILRARDQLVRAVREVCRRPSRAAGESNTRAPVGPDEAVRRALLAAFSDRVARRREAGGRCGVMVGGRGVRLDARSSVLEAPLFVCVDLDAGRSEARVRQASAIEEAWLPADRRSTAVEIEFDAEARRVRALRRTRYEDLVLREVATGIPADREDEAAARLAEAAAAGLEDALDLTAEPVQSLLTRVACLRAWMPELGLPRMDRDALVDLLPDLCRGRRSFRELRAAPLVDLLKGRLAPAQRSALDREAPERLEVPSGSRIRIRYEEGKPPVLAARIQEVFGLLQTPRLAGGRVPVVLHLLGPNMRPQQVTDDLESFWNRTYPEVRKELRRRYPRHAWPENPATARPERRPRPRSG